MPTLPSKSAWALSKRGHHLLQHPRGSWRAGGKNPPAQIVEREQDVLRSVRDLVELLAAAGASEAGDAVRRGDEAYNVLICHPSKHSL